MSKRKQKHEEHVNHERWLVSYADFITLLFAFFVVMYAISELDKTKLGKVSQSLRFALKTKEPGGQSRIETKPFDIGAKDPFGVLGSGPDEDGESGEAGGTAGQSSATDDLPPGGDYAEAESSPQVEKEQLYRIKRRLEAAITLDDPGDNQKGIEVDIIGDGLRIRVPASSLFEPGSIRLLPDAWPLVQDIAPLLARDRRPVRVDGHEFLEPGGHEESGDEWRLSLLRATRVARMLIDRGSVQAQRMNATGHGSNEPIADITTKDGRASSRRYEIVLLARTR